MTTNIKKRKFSKIMPSLEDLNNALQNQQEEINRLTQQVRGKEVKSKKLNLTSDFIRW